MQLPQTLLQLLPLHFGHSCGGLKHGDLAVEETPQTGQQQDMPAAELQQLPQTLSNSGKANPRAPASL